MSALLMLAVFVCIAPAAWSGGLYGNELSTASQGNAGAGHGAWVPDASAMIHNSAAMTQLDDHAVAGGLSAVLGQVRFDPDPASPSGTESGGNQMRFAPLASFSYAHRVSDRVRAGLAVYSISGSVLSPGDGWAGRFQMTDISLLTLSIAPTVAIRVTEWLSIGGGPIANYGTLDWDLRVAFPPGNESPVRLDIDDWRPSGRVGILIHPSETFALSVTYNSEIDFQLGGSVDLPLGLAANLETEMPLPQFVDVSAWWQVTEDVALLGTFDWEDWSTADDLALTLGPRTIGASTGFQDTYKVGVGMNYRLREDWLLQTGVTLDTSGFKNKDRTVAIPVDRQVRFSVGARHDLGEALQLGFSFTYVNLGQAEVRQGTVRGDYRHNDLFILGLTIGYDDLPWSGKLTIAD